MDGSLGGVAMALKRKWLALIGLCVASGLIGCKKHDLLVAGGPTRVLREPYPLDRPAGNSVIMTMREGQTAEVLDADRSKDGTFTCYEVRLSDGRRGYVVTGQGDSFSVQAKDR
jgi:hypothetical protein